MAVRFPPEPDGASVPRRMKALKLVLSAVALEDIEQTLAWTLERFGTGAVGRYRVLLKHAFHDLAVEPERAGSKGRPELGPGLRTYHLNFSRGRARLEGSAVKHPRHFIVYRRRDELTLEVVRVLHDARELERHVPGD